MLSLHDVMKLSNLTVRKIRFIMAGSRKYRQYEVVYVTIGNPAFYLFLYLTGGELQRVGDVSEPNRWCYVVRRTVLYVWNVLDTFSRYSWAV